MAYGSAEGVAAIAAPDTGIVTQGATWQDRVAALLPVADALIDGELGRSFGDDPVEEDETIFANGSSSVLLLPRVARSVSSVVRVDGVGGGDVVPVGSYVAAGRVGDGFGALLAAAGFRWFGTYAVSAVWADAGGGAVPPEIAYVANYLVHLQLKAENAGPGGLTGPEGKTVPMRRLLKEDVVVGVLAKWRAPSMAAV